MERCWAIKPGDRPTFASIVTLLDSYQDELYPFHYDNSDLDYIEIKQDEIVI